MNMITRNMNNIKNNVESIVANIWNMKDTKADARDYTKPRSWHDQESKQSWPPSRSSLASNALEYGGALMLIRVSAFSNDLCNSSGGGRGWYI
jgi:hypothetical protein